MRVEEITIGISKCALPSTLAATQDERDARRFFSTLHAEGHPAKDIFERLLIALADVVMNVLTVSVVRDIETDDCLI